MMLMIYFAFLLISSNASRIPLFHRDELLSSHKDDHSLRSEARMRRDALRVASLFGPRTDVHWIDDGEYIATIGVGTPPVNQSVAVDTGSDLTWVRCGPGATFDPKNSTSLGNVTCRPQYCRVMDTCNTQYCHMINKDSRGCDDYNHCTYTYWYGGGSVTRGNLVIEKITIGNTTIDLPMGCSQRSSNFSFDGILGLDSGSLSLVPSEETGFGFSYCLRNHSDSNSTGWLDFGRSAFPTNAMWASMITPDHGPGFYYVDLLGIEVAGETVNITNDIFKLNPSGGGGVIIDSGTTVTWLYAEAYIPLRNKFKKKFGNLLNPIDPFQILDTCYYLNGVQLKPSQIPTVSFIFSSGIRTQQPNITVDVSNVLLEVGDLVTCFAFAASDPQTNINIIGGLQQEGIQMSFDVESMAVGFGPRC